MSSGFITETELAELRKKRQDEWDRVRKKDDPLERPEEPYDHRSLFERLQEQKQKKELEFEEAHKLKNMIKGLDDDEIEFLDLVDRTKVAADRKKELEEELELNDYRNRVADLQEKTLDERLQCEKTTTANRNKSATNRNSQQRLLRGVVIKKATNKRTASSTDSSADEGAKRARPDECGLKCIAILPGLGNYSESSSDEESSDSEMEIHTKLDLLGRKIVEKMKED